MNQAVFIKSDIHSKRLNYVLNFIFNDFFDSGYELVPLNHSVENQMTIAYGGKSNQADISIPSSKLIEEGFFEADFNLSVNDWSGIIDSNEYEFDLFGFVFFQLSRYEEYFQKSDDPFGRSRAADSFNAAHNILQTPIIDQCLLSLCHKMASLKNIILKRKEKFRLIHTIDVDQYFAFRGKSMKRTIGGLVHDSIKLNTNRLKHRKQALSDGKDPYDTFSFIESTVPVGVEKYYFFLVGDYDKTDNALDLLQNDIAASIKKLSENATIGVHPSVKSNRDSQFLEKEIDKLEKACASRSKISRQHFLVLEFPNTYRTLIKHNIEDDFTMGYHDDIGFRSGTTNPHYWYDLENDELTQLRIHPFQVMDITLKKYKKLSPALALKETLEIIHACKKVGGPFCLLWHNSSFYDQEGWKGWKEVYQEIIKNSTT